MASKSFICMVTVLVVFSLLACSGNGRQNPADDLAALAGEMAAGKDLREVRFADLDGERWPRSAAGLRATGASEF